MRDKDKFSIESDLIGSLKHVSLLWFSSVLGGASTFFIQVLLARQLTPNDFGVFAAAYSFVCLFVPLAGFGVAQLWLKVYGKEGVGAKRWLHASLKLVAINSLVVVCLILSWVVFGPNEFRSQYILVSLVLHMLGLVMLELMIAKYQLEGRFSLISWWQFSPNLLRLMIVLPISVMTHINLEIAGCVYAFVGLGLIIVCAKQLYVMFRGNLLLEVQAKQSGNESFKIVRAKKNELIRLSSVYGKAWPFGLAVFFQMVYYQSDIIILKYLAGNDVAGVYNVAFVILAVVFILPSAIYQKFLMPKIHYWANYENEFLLKAYRKGNKYMLILGVLSALMILATSSFLIPLLFGSEYTGAVILLNVLVLSIPFVFMAYNSGAVLVTRHHVYRKVKYMGIVAILNVILNVTFIPIYGAEGAAITTVISNLTLFSLYFFAIKRHVFSV